MGDLEYQDFRAARIAHLSDDGTVAKMSWTTQVHTHWSGRRDSKAPSPVIAMPFSLLNLTAKLLNFKGLPEFSGELFCPEFSHQWTIFRKIFVSLRIT